MRFGKNIKLASILDYKEDSLVFVKYALLDKNCKPIFDTGNYSIHNTNEGIGMVYNLAKKRKIR